jgi:hypothetical protein
MTMTYEGYVGILKEDGERSPQELRWKMCTAPVVSLLETGKTFNRYTMICSRRDSVELMQEKRGITSNVQRVNLQEKDYITHELEFAAIVLALKKWRRYLYGTIRLSYVDCQKIRNGSLRL